jgi:hypothetical protein
VEIENVRAALEKVIGGPVDSAAGAERISKAAELLARFHRLVDEAKPLIDTSIPAIPVAVSLAGLPLHRAAEVVLTEAGTPLHARDLGARMKARGWRHPRSNAAKPTQIEHQLAARLPQFPETFRRVAPQTFALTAAATPAPPSGPAAPAGIFQGPGTPVASSIGDSDAPLTDGSVAWRSS